MKTWCLFTAACLLAAPALAQDLNWSELARRPEFWPAHCTLKRPMKFGNGSVAAGQPLDVLKLSPTSIELGTVDGLVFDAPPADTDALALAQTAWRKLTPEQRALTYSAVLQRRDLWPYRVALRQPVNLNTGELRAGTELMLKDVEGADLLVLDERQKALFTVAPRDTDLIDHARQRLANPHAFPGRVAEDLQGKLINPTTGAATALDPAKPLRYYVFYRGAAWCGPCRQFSPTLVKLYNELKPQHPEFDVIYISGDKSAAEMRGYAKEAGFNWRAVPSSRQPELQIVNPLFQQYIPQMVVTDAQGKVLIDSARMDRAAALKKLAALLQQPTPGKVATSSL